MSLEVIISSDENGRPDVHFNVYDDISSLIVMIQESTSSRIMSRYIPINHPLREQLKQAFEKAGPTDYARDTFSKLLQDKFTPSLKSVRFGYVWTISVVSPRSGLLERSYRPNVGINQSTHSIFPLPTLTWDGSSKGPPKDSILALSCTLIDYVFVGQAPLGSANYSQILLTAGINFTFRIHNLFQPQNSMSQDRYIGNIRVDLDVKLEDVEATSSDSDKHRAKVHNRFFKLDGFRPCDALIRYCKIRRFRNYSDPDSSMLKLALYLAHGKGERSTLNKFAHNLSAL